MSMTILSFFSYLTNGPIIYYKINYGRVKHMKLLSVVDKVGISNIFLLVSWASTVLVILYSYHKNDNL